MLLSAGALICLIPRTELHQIATQILLCESFMRDSGQHTTHIPRLFWSLLNISKNVVSLNPIHDEQRCSGVKPVTVLR